MNDYTQQDAGLCENIDRAREELAKAYKGVKVIEDWSGCTYKPTKSQSLAIQRSREHLANCLNSRDAFLNMYNRG